MKKNPVLVIAGPTASGKSALAIDAAKAFNGVVINCDSMQIYKGIPVIAATPSAEEKQQVEHRLYELYDCSKRGNVVEWLDLAVKEIKSLWAENKLPVVVGGTGFYIDALINGATPIPEVSAEIRERIRKRIDNDGLEKAHDYLELIDSEAAQKINVNDKTRITRALEIYEFTGKKLSDWYKIPMQKRIPEAEFTVVKIVPSLDEIEQRCRNRLDKMVFEQGALAEISKLSEMNLSDDLPAMKALGVPELSRYIKGESSLEDALNEAKLHTRQYAKRQRTWLRNKLLGDIAFETSYCGQPEFLELINKALNA